MSARSFTQQGFHALSKKHWLGAETLTAKDVKAEMVMAPRVYAEVDGCVVVDMGFLTS
ncbi:MAG: hypothetical protein ACFCA4_07405 [Cyanophyceae cyanobacterium]